MTSPSTSNNTLKAAIIGCGGRGREHAKGYAACEGVEIVALADPVPEAAQALGATHGVAKENLFTNPTDLLASQKFDIVSVCTWPAQHEPQVLEVLKSGARAVHCEKPMAPTFGAARAMHLAAQEANVQLTFCHQRRFNTEFVKARQLIQEGAIGKLQRLEGFCPNLFDWGTHWFDMFFFLNEETPATWVMGQADTSQPKSVFGAPLEYAGLSFVSFENGVDGLLVTGPGAWNRGAVRAIGTDGIIDIPKGDNSDVRLLRAASAWETVDLSDLPSGDGTTAAVIESIDCLRSGKESRLSSRKALAATELIFASYQSAYTRSRVELPLQIDGSPLMQMIEEKASATG
jgi:predicted dehydrogenase